MKHKFLVITGIIAVVAIAAMICLLPESKGTGMSIGIKPENMDMSVRPGDNFLTMQHCHGGVQIQFRTITLYTAHLTY